VGSRFHPSAGGKPLWAGAVGKELVRTLALRGGGVGDAAFGAIAEGSGQPQPRHHKSQRAPTGIPQGCATAFALPFNPRAPGAAQRTMDMAMRVQLMGLLID